MQREVERECVCVHVHSCMYMYLHGISMVDIPQHGAVQVLMDPRLQKVREVVFVSPSSATRANSWNTHTISRIGDRAPDRAPNITDRVADVRNTA